MINRVITDRISSRLFKGKAIIVFGARPTGKSTMVETFFTDKDHLYLNGDNADVREMHTNTTAARLKVIMGNKIILFLDEAQRIVNITSTSKLFTDKLKNVQVIATSSSAFELLNQVNELLTGKKYKYMLYPLSFSEMVEHHGLVKEKRMIE